MQRQHVPAIAIPTGSPWERLEVLLRSPVVVPVYERKLQPLAGLRWPRGIARVAVPGEVALFRVEDEGELQEW